MKAVKAKASKPSSHKAKTSNLYFRPTSYGEVGVYKGSPLPVRLKQLKQIGNGEWKHVKGSDRTSTQGDRVLNLCAQFIKLTGLTLKKDTNYTFALTLTEVTGTEKSVDPEDGDD